MNGPRNRQVALVGEFHLNNDQRQALVDAGDVAVRAFFDRNAIVPIFEGLQNQNREANHEENVENNNARIQNGM